LRPEAIDVTPSNPRPAGEILSMLGIRSASENGRQKVLSVVPNSPAERSGVKKDDFVESIDRLPLTPETVLTDSFEGKILTVTRGGQKLEIKLQNK
jgi:C-terminal processing protease CtpA/Prc